MKIKATNTGNGKRLDAWTTEREPEVALTIIVPFRGEDGQLTDIEVAVERKSLLAAVKAGALNAAV